MARKQPPQNRRPKVAGRGRGGAADEWKPLPADEPVEQRGVGAEKPSAAADRADAATADAAEATAEPTPTGRVPQDADAAATASDTGGKTVDPGAATDTGETTADTGEADTAQSDTAQSDTAQSAATERTAVEDPADDDPVDDRAADDPAVDDTAVVDPAEADTEGTRPVGKRKRPVSRVSTLRPGDAETRAAEPTGSTPAGRRISLSKGRGGSARPRTSVSRPRGFGKTTIGVLLAIAAVLAVIALVAAWHPGAKIGPNRAFVDQAATTELVSQTSSKVCLVNAADGTKFDEWSKQALAALTGEARKQFEDGMKVNRQVLVDAKSVNECHMESVGVKDLSEDGTKATVLVTMTISGTANGGATSPLAPRYQLGMSKHGDAWLIEKVDDLDPQR